jgi:primosomal protein N' (replication factor Y)
MQPPTICPHCNSAYIRYSGSGTEKIESELSREFPQAAIKMVDNLSQLDMSAADIFIATEGIFSQSECMFDLSAALAIDNSLNRPDLRAAEKTLALLLKLLEITKTKMFLQTGLAHHHCFRALAENKISTFYEEELKGRRQLDFPPYQHLALVKIRGLKESRVRETAGAIFEKLKEANKTSLIKIMSVNPAHPSKLRGNFYWQILLRSDNAQRITRFLKMHLKHLPHSGIIVTVDVDPL